MGETRGASEYLQGCTNGESLEKLAGLKMKLAALLMVEEKYWKQRAKAYWLNEGDLNTRFFHQMASTWKKCNKILGLFDDNNNWVQEASSLEGIILSYFTELFIPSKNIVNIDHVTSNIRGNILA